MATAKIVLEVSHSEYILILHALGAAQAYMDNKGGYWSLQPQTEAMLARFDENYF